MTRPSTPGAADHQPATAHRDERAGLIAGIRALADYLEQHPDLPVSSVVGYGPWVYSSALDSRDAREQILTTLGPIAASLDRYEPRQHDRLLTIEQKFAPDVRYEVSARLEDACTPRIRKGKVVWQPPSREELLTAAADAINGERLAS